jgi:hypothetical protein
MRALISDSIADRRFIVTLLAVTAALALLKIGLTSCLLRQASAPLK